MAGAQCDNMAFFANAAGTVAGGGITSNFGLYALTAAAGATENTGVFVFSSGASTNNGIWCRTSGGTSYGGRFEAESRAVWATNTSTAGGIWKFGVYGEATQAGAGAINVGVYGTASGTGDCRGVVGDTTASASRGVGGYVSGTGTDSMAVEAQNRASGAGNQYGLLARSDWNTATGTHYAVYATAGGTGTTNYGIYAEASGAATNWAAYFSGNTTTTGVASIGGAYTDIYVSRLWVTPGNIHVGGNEDAAGQPGGTRTRVRVGNAWGWPGLYAEVNSNGTAQDLVLGATSGYVRSNGWTILGGSAAARLQILRIDVSGDAWLFWHPDAAIALYWDSVNQILYTYNGEAGYYDVGMDRQNETAGAGSVAQDMPGGGTWLGLASGSFQGAGWTANMNIEAGPNAAGFYPGFSFQGSGYGTRIKGIITYWR